MTSMRPACRMWPGTPRSPPASTASMAPIITRRIASTSCCALAASTIAFPSCRTELGAHRSGDAKGKNKGQDGLHNSHLHSPVAGGNDFRDRPASCDAGGFACCTEALYSDLTKSYLAHYRGDCPASFGRCCASFGQRAYRIWLGVLPVQRLN